jgi:hypothetical protein
MAKLERKQRRGGARTPGEGGGECIMRQAEIVVTVARCVASKVQGQAVMYLVGHAGLSKL